MPTDCYSRIMAAGSWTRVLYTHSGQGKLGSGQLERITWRAVGACKLAAGFSALSTPTHLFSLAHLTTKPTPALATAHLQLNAILLVLATAQIRFNKHAA